MITVGEKRYILASHLNINDASSKQIFKTIVTKIEDSFYILEIKHYKTKRCNKVRIKIDKETYEIHSIGL